MKQLKKIAAAVLIAAMLGLLLPQLGVNAEALKRGSRGDLVRQLQTRLRSWGYYSGTVDGVYGAKTESAVRITHIPTGIVAQCQDEKSQLKNREKCMRVLRSRVLEMEQEKQRAATAQDRKNQVGTGDRSERIRTYNYPQGRVTDHRIGLTLHRLDAVLNGDLDEILDALITAQQSKLLQQVK